MLLALVALRSTPTNAALAAAAPAGIDCRTLTPRQALALEALDYAVVGRLDVKPTLDGVDDGLTELGALLARGVRTLNPPSALLGAHDKLLTSRILHGAGLPHPRTTFLGPGGPLPAVTAPVVVKPRFGSWGRDVVICDDDRALQRHLRTLERRPWFRRQGALVQELVPPQGRDLRIVVAGGTIVGAIERVAAPGEWRTNVALGATRIPVEPPPSACALAVHAAGAAGADLIGVDLLPDGSGGHVVLELNGAVEFTREYTLDRDPFTATVCELTRAASGDYPDEREDDLVASDATA
jgi:RimK family alpha-L-glutamate ligase